MSEQITLVLGGGGQCGIAWEIGLLKGLADHGIELRLSEQIIGTSAGSQVGAVIASNKTWEEIWNEQIDEEINEVNPNPNMGEVFDEYERITKEATNGDDWVEKLCEFAKTYQVAVTEDEHIKRIKERIGDIQWGDNLIITGTDIETVRRKTWKQEDNINIHQALSASSSLPGVWPPTTIDGKQYSDGGSYSMENADLATETEKVIILSPNVQVDTPISLKQQVDQLIQEGKQVLSLIPNASVVAKFNEMGNNPVDPSIRKVIAAASREQGLADSNKVKEFLKNL